MELPSMILLFSFKGVLGFTRNRLGFFDFAYEETAVVKIRLELAVSQVFSECNFAIWSW